MSDTVLVTGISGVIAGHVALGLLKAGYRVRGSLRSPGRADAVRTAWIEARHSNNGRRRQRLPPVAKRKRPTRRPAVSFALEVR